MNRHIYISIYLDLYWGLVVVVGDVQIYYNYLINFSAAS